MMQKAKYFYNYVAQKKDAYSKYNYGILDITCDPGKCVTSEAWYEIRKNAKEGYPDADDINFTAFNKV